jgi:DNA-binding transcriptional regulator YdaS (Cro superfamily)
MTVLKEWLKGKPRGTQQTLARAIGVSETWLSLLVTNRARCSPHLANAIQQATGGEVTREALRPDVFGAP